MTARCGFARIAMLAAAMAGFGGAAVADLKFQEMAGSDGGLWSVDLVIEKQEFTVR